MGKFDGIMIFADFDNTLTARGVMLPNRGASFNINPKNYEAVKYFTTHGGKFVMASGRNPNEIAPLKEFMPIYDVAICTNGSLFSFSQNRPIRAITLDEEFFEDFRRIVNEFPVRNWRVTDADFVNFGWDVGQGDCYDELLKRKAPFYKMTFWGRDDEEYSKKLIAYLKSNYGEKYTVEASAPNFFELYGKDGGKAKAVKLLSTAENAKTVICIGDQENDIPMIRCADFGVCVGDGSNEAKSAADYVVAPSYEGAIDDLIRIIDSGEIKLQ